MAFLPGFNDPTMAAGGQGSGLLGILGLSSGDAQKDAAISHGLLQAGLSLLGARGRLGPALGQAGMVGLQGMQQYGQQQTQQQLQKMQMEQLKYQQGQQERQKQMQALPSKFLRPPSVTGVDATGGPETALDNPNNQGGPGGFDYKGYIDALAGVDPVEAVKLKTAMQKDESPLTVKEGETLLDRYTHKPIYTSPKQPTPTDVGKLLTEFNALSPNDPRRATYLDAIKKATTHQPATQVSVNTGKEGIANELKMRDDFRSEPIYKAHQEVRSAYSQIQQGLKLQSPAGDLAAATKIMKLLDPGSVVRESELGMAMAATGLLDRVSGYATNIVKGTKLTPAQRKDFQTLADALYGESAKQFNAKQGEYQTFAKDWGLNGPRITGLQAAPPQGNVVDFGSLK